MTARPDDPHFEWLSCTTEADEHSRIVSGCVARVCPRPPPEAGSVLTYDADPCPQHVAGLLVSNDPQPNPLVPVADVVDQQLRSSTVVGHHHVDVAVIVDVAESGAAT